MYSVMFRITEERNGVDESIWISFGAIDYVRTPDFGGFVEKDEVQDFWVEIGVAWRDSAIRLNGVHAMEFLKQFRAYNARAFKVMRKLSSGPDPADPMAES